MSHTYRDLTFNPSPSARYAYGRTAEATGAVEAAHATKLAEWPSFVRETFGRLFAPKDAERRALPAPSVEPWAGKATAALTSQAAFAELQAASRSHRVVAAQAAATLAGAVAGALGLDKLPGGAPEANDPRTMERRVRRLAEEAERCDAEGDAAGAAEAKAAAEETAREWGRSQARRKALGAKLDGPALGAAVGRAMKAATEQAQNAAEAVGLLAGVGVGGNGHDDEVPADLVRLAMESPDVAAILRLLGKVREAERKADVAPVGQGRLDVVGVTLGRDPTKLVATELARLGHAGTRLDLLRRLHDGQALVREQRGEKQSERGDFVLLVDRSGSMGGEPIQWARAVAFAMMLRALREGRTVVLVMFDHEVSAQVAVKPGDGAALANAARALLMEAGGGTDAVKACAAARALLSPDARQRVDTVIVTDGYWSAEAEQVAALRRSGGTFRAVLIGAGAQSHPWLDGVWQVDGKDPATGGLLCAALFDKAA